jgi:Domain of unknown function (DUF4258)
VKVVRWTLHALDNLKDREISRLEAERTLENPEFDVPGRPPRRIFMRRYFDDILKQEMLLRLIIEDSPMELVVLTIYKTSQLKKYLREIKP